MKPAGDNRLAMRAALVRALVTYHSRSLYMMVKKTWRKRLTALINTARRNSHASPDIISTVEVICLGSVAVRCGCFGGQDVLSSDDHKLAPIASGWAFVCFSRGPRASSMDGIVQTGKGSSGAR